MRLTCGKYDNGWICEEHPDLPWPHDDCGGPGVPCENPACDFSIIATGLVCPSCHRAQGEIKTQTHRVIGFACRACGYLRMYLATVDSLTEIPSFSSSP